MITRFVILGCGHTGTTLLSGIFHISGFGSTEINRLFESQHLLDLDKRLLVDNIDQTIYQDAEEYFQTLETKTHGRWCLKDPRLTLTIHHLYPLMPKPIKILYNFRDPRNTITHLLKEREKWCPEMTREEAVADAENEWLERNASTLSFLRKHPDIEYLMINYDDLVDGRLDDVINRFVGKEMNYEFIQPRKRRSPPMAVTSRLAELYQEILQAYPENLANCLLTTTSPQYGIFRKSLKMAHKFQYRLYFLKQRLSRRV